MSIETPKFIINSFLFSGHRRVHLPRRRRADGLDHGAHAAPGRGTMDALTTLILAIPGTAIGIAYIRAFHFPLPVIDLPLTSMWIILPLVLAVRRLPYTVRGSYSSLLLVHKSMEEAAENVGATKLRTFRDITVPLVWKGILVGALFSFITSIQEASATIFLTLGGWEMIPVRHLHLLHRGLAEPGGRARRDPDRAVRAEPVRRQPHRRDAGRRPVRLTCHIPDWCRSSPTRRDPS